MRSILDIQNDHNHEASIYIHVDDTSIQAKGDFNTAANGVINTTLSFVKAANRLKLPLATTDDKKTPKAVCVASSQKLCKYVTQQLA